MTNEQLDAIDAAITQLNKAVNLLVEEAGLEWDDENVLKLLNVQANLDDTLESHEPQEEQHATG
jgi:hypothetical protein